MNKELYVCYDCEELITSEEVEILELEDGTKEVICFTCADSIKD